MLKSKMFILTICFSSALSASSISEKDEPDCENIINLAHVDTSSIETIKLSQQEITDYWKTVKKQKIEPQQLPDEFFNKTVTHNGVTTYLE